MMHHTPPTFTPGSYDPPVFNKRQRAGSISGRVVTRLRSASDLCDEGIITPQEKGIIKDLIITGDAELETALEDYEKGDPQQLQGLLRGGTLAQRRASIDLLADDLDMGVLNVGSLDSDKPDTAFNLDDIPFNPAIGMGRDSKARADSFSDVFGSSFGLGGSFGGNSLGVSLGQSAQRGTVAAQAASAAAPSAFPFGGATPPEHTFADDVLDNDGTFSAFPGLSFPDVPPLTSAGAGSMDAGEGAGNGLTVPEEPALVGRRGGGSKKNKKGGKGSSGNKSSSRPPRSSPASTSRAVSAPIGIPGAKGRSATSISGKPGGRKIGAYSPEARKARVQRYLEKRKKRVWTKKVKYDVRKNFADSRLRVKGRFVKKEDEAMLRELIQMT